MNPVENLWKNLSGYHKKEDFVVLCLKKVENVEKCKILENKGEYYINGGFLSWKCGKNKGIF